jgi:sulfonate transport system ATP-binding protein
MLEIASVAKCYGAFTALDGVALTVAPGEVVSLVGPSGCGKSTLLRIVAGLDRAFTGQVAVGGRPVTCPSPEVGVVFQEPRLMPWLTVAENIAFGTEGVSPWNPVVAEAARQVGLGDFLKAYPRQLSGGMAQRCAIARALLPRPSVLLLDEPFSALDAFTRMNLQDLLLDLAATRGTTMLLVTHDVDEALYLSDRVLVLAAHPGRVEEELAVGLPHPRDRRDARFGALRARILTRLMELQTDSAAD